MNTNEVLQKARALIAQGWCTYHMAEDARGIEVDALSSVAVKFCASGAIGRLSGCREPLSGEFYAAQMMFREADRILRNKDFVRPITWINDHTSQEYVLKVFDKAIELCADAT